MHNQIGKVAANSGKQLEEPANSQATQDKQLLNLHYSTKIATLATKQAPKINLRASLVESKPNRKRYKRFNLSPRGTTNSLSVSP